MSAHLVCARVGAVEACKADAPRAYHMNWGAAAVAHFLCNPWLLFLLLIIPPCAYIAQLSAGPAVGAGCMRVCQAFLWETGSGSPGSGSTALCSQTGDGAIFADCGLWGLWLGSVSIHCTPQDCAPCVDPLHVLLTRDGIVG